jgi:hypothetical protein
MYKGGGHEGELKSFNQRDLSVHCSPGVLGLAVGALIEAARVYGNYLH